MVISEWHVPFSLVTQEGTLDFNVPFAIGGGEADARFMLNEKASTVNRALRVSADDLPNSDGEIFHDRFTKGWVATLAIQFWEEQDRPACGSQLRRMYDVLGLYTNACLRPVDPDNTRLIWTPSGYPTGVDKRMLQHVYFLDEADIEFLDAGLQQLKVQLDTPFPYAIDFTQDTYTFSGTTTITLDGNVPFWPVIKVHGPTSAFTITNNDTGEVISWSSALGGIAAIGAGDYGEMDTFRGGTFFLNGSGRNLNPGLIPNVTRIFALSPGANSITVSGATAEFLVNNAWA